MKPSYRFSIRKSVKLISFLSIIWFFASFALTAQSVPDFSGIWVQDTSKSDDFYKNFNVKLMIVQNNGALTVKTTFSDNSGKELVTRESTFSLDDKETVNEDGTRRSARWIPDTKSLETSDTKDYGGDIVGVKTLYSISDDGLILNVKTSDIKPDVKAINQVFNKEK